MRSRITRQLGGLFGAGPPHPPIRSLFLATVDVREAQGTRLPGEFSWHDYAVYLLHIAAEIEHSLMVQYLYAAYSLGGKDIPASQRANVLRWQNTILGIAKEEMGHFLTVQNVLRLIGGSLNLDREDFPWDVPFYPFPFALQPLSRFSLAQYIFAESPDDWPSDLTTEQRREIESAAGSSPIQMPHRVGQLYALLIAVIENLQALPDSIFREETVPFQASWDEWGRGYRGGRSMVSDQAVPDVLARRMSSRSEAMAALQAIARQGEWPEEDPKAQELSHFRRFLQVLREFPKDKDWSPTWAVPTNPQAPGIAVGDGPVIEHTEAGVWASLFNLRYRMLLTYLAHSFTMSAEPLETGVASPRGLIISRTFVEMYNLRSMAGVLVTLPLKSDQERERAGPPFQMPYSLRLPAEEADCWRLHLDLIDAAEVLLTNLNELSTPRSAYAQVVLNADRQAKVEVELLMRSCERGEKHVTVGRSLAI